MERSRKKLRRGYTTGTCAAAAAKGAARMLFTGERADRVELRWSAKNGESHDVVFPLEGVELEKTYAKCAVRKDAGDDIDVTDGMRIYAKVSRIPEQEGPENGSAGPESPPVEDEANPEEKAGVAADLSSLVDENGVIPMRWDRAADFLSAGKAGETGSQSARTVIVADGKSGPASGAADGKNETKERFVITGGDGIGTVTKPGLDQPPGNPAINSGPRRMITDAVEQVCDAFEYEGRLEIEISAPGGDEAAEKTFNARVGVVGGISILGTTGIVEPMSGRAVADTVRAEVRVKASESDFLAFVPGNSGAEFVNRELRIPESRTVIISNYPGAAIDQALESGVKRVLIAGSLGKMIKLAGGIFNTHSHEADARMDILIRCALEAGAPVSVLRQIDGCVTTEAAVDLLDSAGLLDTTMEIAVEKAASHVRRRAGGMSVELIFLRNSGGVLAFTDGAVEMAEETDE